MHDSLISSLGTLLHNAPVLILYGCGVLFVATVCISFSLRQSSRNVRLKIRDLTSLLELLREDNAMERRNGLSLERLDQIRVKCESLDGLPGKWWRRVDEKIEPYLSPEEKEGWFLTENPRSVLPYEVIVGRNFNATFFGTYPGILTGFGLMLTFLAILLGLLGVHYDKANTIEPISGIDTLINGLSGKFLSSILALFLSIVFTFYEKSVVRGLKMSYERMLTTLSDIVPYLHSTRILLDMHRFSAKQTVSVSNISAEVVDRLTNAFNERVVPRLAAGMSDGVADKLQIEFRPTMERMAGSLDGLQSAIVGLESEKQQSVTGEFEKMAKSLEQSITNALTTMASQFHEALTGSAKQEFGNVQGTLEAAGQVLSQMNVQCSSMQETLSLVISKAGETTTSQLDNSREQAEAMTELMHGLMNKLQATADQNMNSMQTQLTRVVSDLTEKVTGLSVDMMDAAKDMASHSQQSASTIIEKTDAWSESTAKRLESLLSNIENRSQDFKEASTALLDAKIFMSNLLAQNANALAQMADASRNVQTYSTGLVGQSDALKAVSSDQAKVANQLLLTTGGLKGILDHSQKLLGEYRQTITEYKSVIDSLDVSLGKIMQTTNKGLGDYNQSVEKNFTKICDIANEMVPKAANLLNTQIADLGDQLDSLGEVISKSLERANGRAR